MEIKKFMDLTKNYDPNGEVASNSVMEYGEIFIGMAVDKNGNALIIPCVMVEGIDTMRDYKEYLHYMDAKYSIPYAKANLDQSITLKEIYDFIKDMDPTKEIYVTLDEYPTCEITNIYKNSRGMVTFEWEDLT